ncbi:hypothetical protein [Devosia sp.]|uniref:hypothetical protein n=1 Tax=Devosia sp. TaxID=1871048 RepID=UPI003A917963
MFLLRSAFWLTLAFVFLAPKGADPGADLQRAASEIRAVALEQGSKVVTHQLLSTDCATLECVGGKAVLAGFTDSQISPSSNSTMQELQTAPVPFPRPRPDRMG